ncbi:MAG: hypothetical protein SPL42_04045 [Bacteroidales bacterium]|nr:hypothetical protein [Bacteroidales bacterium]
MLRNPKTVKKNGGSVIVHQACIVTYADDEKKCIFLLINNFDMPPSHRHSWNSNFRGAIKISHADLQLVAATKTYFSFFIGQQ